MNNRPLADIMRPTDFSQMTGQRHLFGETGVITRMCSGGRVTNMIFFGPPGTGKTTAAGIIAEKSGMRIKRLNATTASLSDVRDVIADSTGIFSGAGLLLYLDEIQYFNKKQQQSLLEFIENGQITLIASTTENPYLYVYNAVISRCSVFEFKPISAAEMTGRLGEAASVLKSLYPDKGDISVDESILLEIAGKSGGDMRRALNLLEAAYLASEGEISSETLQSLSSGVPGSFDRDGTTHYDLVSALQKSVRGSDPNAAVFYLARLLEGGDLEGACRRIRQMACEDIGLAYPQAASVTEESVSSALKLGMPEASAPLSMCIIMLATAPKSNSAMEAYSAAKKAISEGKGQIIPSHLRQTDLFCGYRYPHDFPDHYVKQQYLPDDLLGNVFYHCGDNRTERAADEYWKKIKSKNI